MEEVGVKLVAQGFDDFQGTMRGAEKSVTSFADTVGGFSLQFSIFENGATAAGKAVKGMAPDLKAWGSAMKDAQTQTVAFTSTTRDITEFKSTFSSTSKEITSSTNSAKTSIISFGGAIKGMAGSVAGFAGGALVSTISGMAGAAGKAASAMLDLGKAALGTASAGIKAVGGLAAEAAGKLISMGIEAGKAGLSMAKGFVGDSVKVYTDFSQKISGIAAVAGATAEELQQMSNKALELGAKFPVSASQAADAMANLASAGFTAKDAIGGADSVVLLATAGHLDMDKSADILSSSMNGFGLITTDTTKNIAEAARVTDLMAATANASAVSITDIGSTMKYVAPTAKAAGYEIEDMSKAIGMMGNAGIKGSSAGTALRSVIVGLTASSGPSADAMAALGVKATDAAGNTRPFTDVIGDLRDKFKGLSQADKIDFAKKIAGKEAMSGLLSIVDASDESYKKMSDSIDKASGSASTMAGVMSDNLNGKLQNMQGSVETLQIKLGKSLSPAFGLVYDAISNLANQLGPFADSLGPRVVTVIDKLQDGANKAASGFSLFLGAFNSGFVVPPAWEGLAATMGRLGEALAPLKTAVGDLVAAILPAAIPADAMAKGLGDAGTAATNAHPVIDAISGLVTNFLVPGVEKAARLVLEMKTAFEMAQTALAPFLPTIGDFAGKAVAVYQAISPLNIAITAFEGFMTGGLPGAVTALGGNVTNLGNAFGVDLSGPVKTVTDFLTTQLVPGITSIAQTVIETAPKVIQFGQDFLNTVLPPIQTFVGWVQTNVGPVVSSAFSTLQTTVMPALSTFAAFFGNTVIPKVSEFVSYVGEKITPILEKGFSILSTTVIPTIGNLVSIIATKVIPILFGWWSVIATVLKPVFDVIVGVISNFLLPAIKDIWGFINDPLIPIFSKIADIIQDPVMPALQGMADFFNNTMMAAINTIVGVWDGFTQRIGDGASGIGKIFKGDLVGAADDFRNAVVGRTKEAGEAVSTWVTGVATASTTTKTSLTGAGADWGTLATTVDTKTAAMAKSVEVNSFTINDEGKKVIKTTSDWGTATEDVGKKSDDATPKVDNFAKSATNAIPPLNNATTSANSSSGAFKGVADWSDTAATNLAKYSGTPVTDKKPENNFSAAAGSIKEAKDRLDAWNATQPQSKSVTYTTTYKQVGSPSAVPYASGTSYHPGGPAIVGEAGPEQVSYPSGKNFIAMAPMTIPDMPRGTSVLAAPATRGLLSNGGQLAPSAGASHIINNTTSIYTDARQFNLNMQSMQSTGSLATDFGLLQVGA